jgi:hypothetical protein
MLIAPDNQGALWILVIIAIGVGIGVYLSGIWACC